MRVLLLLAVLVVAGQASRHALEFLHNKASGELIGAPDATQDILITIAIKQQNTDKLEEYFWRVSDPRSPSYGNHLTFEQVKQLVAPSDESINAVKAWLEANDITEHQMAASGDFLRVKTTVEKAESLLQTSIGSYRHDSGRTYMRASTEFSIPSELKAHIDFVGGLSNKITLPAAKLRATDIAVTPVTIKQFFNMTGVTGKNKGNSQAVAQFLEQYYAPKDLQTFQKDYNLPQNPVTKVVGPNIETKPGIEATLDIEYIMGVAPNVSTWFVYTDGLYQNQEPFLEWIVNMSSIANAPYVHSVSYGDTESTISRDYAERVNVEFQKYGVMGRSILFASGDDGTGCTGCKKFEPNWPASSPFITSVGGTVLESATSAVGDVIASGGFSNFFAQPSYQTEDVTNYIKAHPSQPAPSFYNATGRAIPDISSFSEDVLIVYRGLREGVAGTSCAAPVVSAVIALLNDVRLEAGKKPLGFLNPLLYQTRALNNAAFYDVVKGDNRAGCCEYGFSAAVGWDPITGVGMPNYPVLAAIAKSL